LDLLVQQVLELQARRVQLVRQALLAQQVQMELSVLMVQLVQLVRRAQGKLVRLVQLA
jgi:hypothetical protein